MTHSILASFDPFATHPFTNGSGLVPEPPMPSQYPILIPSPRNRSRLPSAFPASSLDTSASSSSPPAGSPQTPPHVKAPEPRRILSSNSQPSVTRPIFVPFRQETSSPDLVLKKKSPPKNPSIPDARR
ncbi:hypothetical protein D9615_001881 [Tricholomella constricta]|uniref:Uncharacterized protein n=1 Tax=Tricholomella constricta TaxID=117010 RepID=A0A8H5HPK5_9AGAR|nr:hypothetical protein D9615_001881 [Tricholomella constricta]